MPKTAKPIKAWLIRTGQPWDQDNYPRAIVFKELDKDKLLVHYTKPELPAFSEEVTATVKGERNGLLLLSILKSATSI